MNKLEGWKTLLFNGILFFVGLIEQAGIVLPENFAADLNGAVLMVIAVVGTVLRAVTNSPVGWKKNG